MKPAPKQAFLCYIKILALSSSDHLLRI